ncbi:uncharacterized protein [Dermacentor andersoni]|uniref:uncharacterized protein isoform X5 n=1 Tax=Dermacentor andersoni TaxID=34620 RepID=UPI002417DF8C|nr:uncharacterized protein LOC126531703 isoform X5 [Dermacentor andersoni]
MTSAPSSPKARQGHVRGQERQGQGQETRTRQGQESEQDGESCSLSCKEGEVSDETPTDTAVSGSQEPGRGNPFVEPEISCFWTTLVRDITEKQAWRVKAFDDSSERLLDAYSEDVRHYPLPEERIRMKHRRDAALKLRADPGRWSRLVLAGLRELAADAAGPGTAAIVRTGLLHAFQDFATHIRYFQSISGELYSIDDKMLATLDDFESHPKYYVRSEEDIELLTSQLNDKKTKKKLKAWIYFLKDYREELLQRPYLASYSSKGDHGLEYVPSEETSCTDDIY